MKKIIKTDWGGTPTGSICASCGAVIIYNGNYFCPNLTTDDPNHYAASENEDISDMLAEVLAYRANA